MRALPDSLVQCRFPQLLALLKEAKMKERLRSARADISARFPLPETFWREWIADEILSADRCEPL